MPNFAYKAVQPDGTAVRAQEFADDLNLLEEQLRKRQLILLEAKEVRAGRVNRKLIALFISQFAPLIASGVSVDRALAIINEDVENRQLHGLTSQLYGAIKQGQSLSDAMQASGVFDNFALALAKAGEASGQLAHTLDALERHYRLQAKLRADIVSSLSYPAFLFILSILSLVFMSYYLVPKFQELFSDQLEALPWHTLFIFGASDFIRAFGFYILAVCLAGGAFLVFSYGNNLAMRAKIDGIFMRMPGFSKYINTLNAANILNVLGVLLKNGVPLVRALELTVAVPFTIPTQNGVRDTLNEVRRGTPLHQASMGIPYFPNMARRFIAVGEETGRLDDMTARAGDQLSEQVQRQLKSFSNMLGPVLILLMGLLIAFIVISMLSAVYSFSDFV